MDEIGLISIKKRFFASLIHFLFSIIIVFFVLVLVFYIWYPGALAEASGVAEIFFLVLIVDVCLGPLLTFVVFDIKKKGLKRDLLIILLIQLSALFYGIYTVGVVRPAFIVFAVDRFELVYANELSKEQLRFGFSPEYKRVSMLGPKWVAAKMPEDIAERNLLLFQALEGGADLAQSPRYYLSYQEMKSEIIAKSKPLQNLEQFNLEDITTYLSMIDRYDHDIHRYYYLPLQAKKMDLAVVIDRFTADVVEVVDLEPWG